MYNLILMKADYEPWWQFEDIEEKYIEVMSYPTIELYEQKAVEILTNYRENYEFEKSKEGKYFAFWNKGEVAFCEGCDEDLQIYHGIIFSHPIGTLVK